MAALPSVSEQKLEDGIHRLLKLSSVPEMRQILEQTTELSSADQHAEQELVEESKTIDPIPSQLMTGPRQVTAVAEQSFASRMAVDLANGLTNVLVRAIQDLDRHISLESERLNSTFGQRLDKLQSSVESLQPLHHRIEDLVQAGAAAQERFDILAATTALLGAAHQRLDTDIAGLKAQIDEVSASMDARIDEVCRRVELRGRELSSVQADASEVASKMAIAAERLERHATALRALHDSHRERTQVFGQMGELLHRLNHESFSTEAAAL